MTEDDSPTPRFIISPNTVLANALLRTIDIIRPRVITERPASIEFVVGTQINGAPHLGTNLVQASAFLLAKLARRRFSLSTSVKIVALDNASHDIILDPEAYHAYQKTYFHQLGSQGVADLIRKYYLNFFESLSDATDAEYSVQTYTEQQASPEFRRSFLQTLPRLDDIRWWLAPSHGSVHLRVPCPVCGWAEKRSERTKIVRFDTSEAVISSWCFDHGPYEVKISSEGNGYLDLNTLYRNLVKERAHEAPSDVLRIMVKGGDWIFGCQLVDGAHAAMGLGNNGLPMRVFAPQILSPTGAKLSKSLLKDPEVKRPAGVTDWMLDSSRWPSSIDAYVDRLLWMVETCMEDPKDFYRAFTTEEIARIWNMAEVSDGARVRSMPIYKRFFDMIAAGTKTIEIRVAYSSMKRIQPGQLIRFECRAENCLTRVQRVTKYANFEEMLDKEELSSINKNISRDEQLKELRKIFSPDREALGVLAIEVKKE